MYQRRSRGQRKEESIAVAIDKVKGSQYALKWAIDHLLSRGQTVTLLHVKQKAASIPTPLGNRVAITDVNDEVARAYKQQLDSQAREVFLPFHCFCSRKDIQCHEVILEDLDIAKALIDYVSHLAIETLVVGAGSRSGFVRFKSTDIPSSVTKGAPTFCTVYVISKGKIASVRSASSPVPTITPHRNQVHNQVHHIPEPNDVNLMQKKGSKVESTSFVRHNLNENLETKSPFTRGRASLNKSYGGLTLQDTDISFVSSARPSIDRMFPSFYDNLDPTITPWSPRSPRLSNSNEQERNFGLLLGAKAVDMNSSLDCSSTTQDNGIMSWSPQNRDDAEAEMRRLKLELKQTMNMYSTACKEALNAKQKAKELQHWKLQEERKLEEARLAEEAALALMEMEKAKCKAAIEAAEASQRIAELEAQKRLEAEKKALKEAEEKKKLLYALAQNDVRYRRYTIEEIERATAFFSESLKIGEGGYGPVYKCYLDHTPVAVKVLSPDAAHGRSQFQQEVEVLSCIRHPNMVILLGACPEHGSLVYEYMENGSLDDCLFRRRNTPVLSWQQRFRIAAEIGTGLLFLHQTKPEPLVHRDLKPGNILLNHNYVSKISDVGLARLVPPSVADLVTQYRMTSTAGTFCYIDPEYQQTGMLGIKSDIYSLGILFLQLITAKPPMGLTHHVERAIEKGTLTEMLDPAVPDWPVEDTLKFAKIALQCAEMRRKDRPDLGNVVLPELNRLRALAEENMPGIMLGSSAAASPKDNHVSTIQDLMNDPQLLQNWKWI